VLQRFDVLTATRSIPERILYFAELWMGGMFLQDEAYVYMRERRNPFASGLLYTVLLGVLIAAGGLLGALARYATSPSLDAIKNTVLAHLQAMPFYEQMSASAQGNFITQFNQTWELLAPLLTPYPAASVQIVQLLASPLTIPLGMAISWGIYGALAHWVARRWNPEISLGEILGPLALASSPQLLNVLNVFPNVGISPLVTFLWFLVSAITAIRVTYRTTGRNAVLAAFFPIVLGLVILAVLILVPLLLLTRGGQ
jgi:hypothetical protein